MGCRIGYKYRHHSYRKINITVTLKQPESFWLLFVFTFISRRNVGYGREFAAAVTVDAGITVGSSVAGAMIAGAMAGSFAPGVGTIFGAVVGLSAGLIANATIRKPAINQVNSFFGRFRAR
ncbi:hypothetical protein RH915_10430 [Serpentinicella sp. ANB-PHB4]|uniref:hypothetical protein n=1 Tax=Serpentinicella sp. ANB-PHB4 TaxID=3074076 RepID=UPI002858E736|nr:hypothetical protein [Serpentinicella sp. ANB-PHB4]MDR5659904.1 hypothetical protein [Serpentinicella sp. ANB-PHB4]